MTLVIESLIYLTLRFRRQNIFHFNICISKVFYYLTISDIYASAAGPESTELAQFMIFLLQPPKCWHYMSYATMPDPETAD